MANVRAIMCAPRGHHRFLVTKVWEDGTESHLVVKFSQDAVAAITRANQIGFISHKAEEFEPCGADGAMSWEECPPSLMGSQVKFVVNAVFDPPKSMLTEAGSYSPEVSSVLNLRASMKQYGPFESEEEAGRFFEQAIERLKKSNSQRTVVVWVERLSLPDASDFVG